MPSITDAQKQIYLTQARALCFDKDLLEFISDQKGGAMRNPQFDDCVGKEYDKLVRRGAVTNWFSNEGGIPGILQSLSTTANQVQNIANQQQYGVPGGTSNTQGVPGAGATVTFDSSGRPIYTGTDTRQGTSPFVWISVLLIIILLIAFMVFVFKKGASKKS